MEAVLVTIAIATAVICSNLNYLSGVWATPSSSIYLGTVHWAGDYFYYLSQFAQGRDGLFLSYDLFTGDFPYKTAVGWVNVFMGRAAYITGINHVWAYQIAVFIFSTLFLLFSYLLIREIFKGKDSRNSQLRITAFILFILSNTIPKIISVNGMWTVTFFDYWFNNGLPFNRLANVPHQLIAKAIVSLILLLAIVWYRGYSKRRLALYLALFLMCGLVLASTEPVHFAIVTLVMLLVPLLFYRKNYVMFIPLIFFAGGGLPATLYIKKLFTDLPYSQLAAWELTQSIKPDILNFVLSNGILMVIAIIGALQFYKKGSVQNFTIVIFCFLTIVLFLSPVPSLLGIVNVRFMPAATTIFIACIAANTVWEFAKKAGKRSGRVYWGIIALIIIINVLPLPTQLKNKVKADRSNAYFYVDKKVYDTFEKAAHISSMGDQFLVVWPFNTPFPGVAGRHSFNGHPLLTINSSLKDKTSSDFFYDKMNKEEMDKFVILNNIDFVIAYGFMQRIKNMDILENVYDNGMLSIYKVKKA